MTCSSNSSSCKQQVQSTQKTDAPEKNSMSSIQFDPEKITEELRDFNENLLQSYATLKQLSEIQVGQTPKDEIYSEDKLKLYHYRPEQSDKSKQARCKTPLLICYALVNRPYMVDLDPAALLR